MLNKNELKILEPKNWEAIINDKDQILRKESLSAFAITISCIKNENDYQLTKKGISVLQKRLNKYDEENIKPIKQLLAKLKDKVIGQYQKETIDYVKQLKKDLENKAIELGIIKKEEKPEIKKESELDRFKSYLINFIYKNTKISENYLETDDVINSHILLKFIKEWK